MATPGVKLYDTYVVVDDGVAPAEGLKLYDLYVTVEGDYMTSSTAGRLPAILDYLVAQVQVAVGHSRVFARSRLIRNEDTMRTLLVGASGLHFFEVRRLQTSEEHASASSARRVHLLEIVGRMSISDAADSERTMQTELESISDQLRSDTDLNQLCEYARIQATSLTDTLYNEMGVHEGTVLLRVQEHIHW